MINLVSGLKKNAIKNQNMKLTYCADIEYQVSYPSPALLQYISQPEQLQM